MLLLKVKLKRPPSFFTRAKSTKAMTVSEDARVCSLVPAFLIHSLPVDDHVPYGFHL